VIGLPAFSTISTRTELHPLADRLVAAGFRCVLLDWPGFGASDRLDLPYGPVLYGEFLADFVASRPAGAGIVACGHAAGYALAVARAQPGRIRALVLVAPTWRGPLPTVMGEHRRPLYARIRAAVRAPLLGHLLYRVNTVRPVLRMMLRRHVYSEAESVTAATVAAKQHVARQRGARFGSAAFVTGAIDPVPDRASFLALFDPPPAPVLVLRGEHTPPRSAAEMDALATLLGVAMQRVPGALAPHEEHAATLAPAMVAFFRHHLIMP
jgi:pimeloyl-ACP methyl ester carboxylesterase